MTKNPAVVTKNQTRPSNFPTRSTNTRGKTRRKQSFGAIPAINPTDIIKEGLKIVILQFLEVLGLRCNFDCQGYQITLILLESLLSL